MMLAYLIDAYSLIVLASVLLSWMSLPPTHPVVRFTSRLTEPVLGPLRQLLPSMGGLDLSPMLLLVGLRMLKSLLIGALR